MRCRNCFSQIKKYITSEICNTCKLASNVTISTTNAKKKYALTNDEIDEANLFNYEIRYLHARGFKYLVIDIEELAEKIFATVDNNDKRKQKYLKNMDAIEEKMEFIDEMRENIQAYLEDRNLEPDTDALKFIEEIIKRKYNSDLEEVVTPIKRKIKLDALMINKSDKFVKKAKKHIEYDAYVYDHHLSLLATFDEINKDVKNSINSKSRRTRIDKFIEKNINNSSIYFLSSLPIYETYVTQFPNKINFHWY